MSDEPLLRSLSLRDAVALVVGTVIGTGIFLKTTVMAQETGSATAVLLAWLAAGLLSLVGALTYAELGSLFPRAGGEYVYLREAFGDLVAFLYGWMRFWIASPGSIAAYAVGAVTFVGGVVDLGPGANRALAAVALVAVFTAVNCFSVGTVGRLNSLMTGLKVVMCAGLGIGLLLFARTGSPGAPASASAFGWPGFGAAMLAALWAFDGWNNLPMASGEVRDAQRVVPRALVIGILAVLGLYGLVNIAYFRALPLSGILAANSSANPEALPVAASAASVVFGPAAVAALSIMTAFSALSAMNAAMLTGARVPFAMARDHLVPGLFGAVSARRVPVTAIIAQGLWASVLALSGTFDQLTDYVIFASWIFYGLCVLSLFRFRRTHAGVSRHFSTPLYPWLPLVFLAATLLLLVNTLMTAPLQSLTGLGLLCLGLPAFWVMKRSRTGR